MVFCAEEFPACSHYEVMLLLASFLFIQHVQNSLGSNSAPQFNEQNEMLFLRLQDEIQTAERNLWAAVPLLDGSTSASFSSLE